MQKALFVKPAKRHKLSPVAWLTALAMMLTISTTLSSPLHWRPSGLSLTITFPAIPYTKEVQSQEGGFVNVASVDKGTYAVKVSFEKLEIGSSIPAELIDTLKEVISEQSVRDGVTDLQTSVEDVPLGRRVTVRGTKTMKVAEEAHRVLVIRDGYALPEGILIVTSTTMVDTPDQACMDFRRAIADLSP